MDKARFEIEPALPYSLHHTLARLTAFPENVDRYDGEAYRRLVFVESRPLLVEFRQLGSPSRARLEVRLRGDSARSTNARRAAEDIAERVLGARIDLRPFYRRFRSDRLLGPILKTFRGLRVVGRRTTWETLLQIVLSQQVNLSFAHSILYEMSKRLGRRARFDGERYFDFPTSHRLARMSEAELRAFRLSGAKAGTLLRLAEAYRSRELTDEKLVALTDDEVLRTLTAYKGVGRWTAEFTLLRGLGRMDVFPGGDLGVVKYLAKGLLGHDEVASEDKMREFAERWRPYRGLALIYTYAELARRAKVSDP